MKIIGIDANWKRDALIGTAVAVGFFLAGSVVHFSVADLFINLVYPNLLSTGGILDDKFLVIAFLAGTIEEPAFRGVLPYFYTVIFTKFHIPNPIFWADRISNVTFSAFHAAAYGIAATAAFIGAYVFGEIATFMKYHTDSQATNMALHVVTNSIIIGTKFVVVGV